MLYNSMLLLILSVLVAIRIHLSIVFQSASMGEFRNLPRSLQNVQLENAEFGTSPLSANGLLIRKPWITSALGGGHDVS